MKINRRQFLSLSALIFAPYCKVNADENCFKELLNEIQSPFQMSIFKERYSVNSLTSKLSNTSNVNELSENKFNLHKSSSGNNIIKLWNKQIFQLVSI